MTKHDANDIIQVCGFTNRESLKFDVKYLLHWKMKLTCEELGIDHKLIYAVLSKNNTTGYYNKIWLNDDEMKQLSKFCTHIRHLKKNGK